MESLGEGGLCPGKPLLEHPGIKLSEEMHTDSVFAISVPWRPVQRELTAMRPNSL